MPLAALFCAPQEANLDGVESLIDDMTREDPEWARFCQVGRLRPHADVVPAVYMECRRRMHRVHAHAHGCDMSSEQHQKGVFKTAR